MFFISKISEKLYNLSILSELIKIMDLEKRPGSILEKEKPSKEFVKKVERRYFLTEKGVDLCELKFLQILKINQ